MRRRRSTTTLTATMTLARLLLGFASRGFAAGVVAASSGWAGEGVKGPAFDCAKASGTVQELVCADEGLAALDRELARVYQAALAAARDGMPDLLRAEQRGWVKGRDECWKAQGEGNPVFLTESWRATTVAECTRSLYRQRIAELQAQWRLVPEKGPVFFSCGDSPADEAVATFFETDPPTVRLERGDRTAIAWQVASGGPVRYEGQNVVFRSEGREAEVVWNGAELRCRRRGEGTAPPGPLAGTEWRLVEIRSMDDAVGTVRPDDPSKYTMRLNGDGTVALRLHCNSAGGTWSAETGPDGRSGRFEFGPLAATLAACPPPSLAERVAAQAGFVRSYLLKDGRLYLSLLADGGVYGWEPESESPFETTPDRALEAAILRASPSYVRDAVDVGGGTGRGRYVYGRADLNGDGRGEVFAYLLGSVFCGTGGCNLLLFTETEGGYSLVDDFPISRLPVVVSPERTHGWNDLFRLESGGGAKASYVRHRFDGRKYVEAERRPADRAPEGRPHLAGDLTFDRGIPLEPPD